MCLCSSERVLKPRRHLVHVLVIRFGVSVVGVVVAGDVGFVVGSVGVRSVDDRSDVVDGGVSVWNDVDLAMAWCCEYVVKGDVVLRAAGGGGGAKTVAIGANGPEIADCVVAVVVGVVVSVAVVVKTVVSSEVDVVVEGFV